MKRIRYIRNAPDIVQEKNPSLVALRKDVKKKMGQGRGIRASVYFLSFLGVKTRIGGIQFKYSHRNGEF